MARALRLADARGFAEVNGASLYYEVAGDGGALVLCHCAPGDSTLWDPQFGPFAETHRVVRFDARGFGQSTLPAGLFSFHEDLRGLLDFLGIERATVLGLSLGGRTALDLALSHPDRVRALVLANSGVSGSTLRPRPAGLADVEAALTRGDTAQAAELMTRVWFDGPRDPKGVDPGVRSWFVARARERFERLRQIPKGYATHEDLDPPAMQRLSAIRCPTLILTSDLDQPGILDLAKQLVASIQGAWSVKIRGAAHIANLERPSEFTSAVATFLSDLRGARL